MDPESLQDLFEDIGPIRVRRMFGGGGLYCGELIFGIVAGGEIYLKADEVSRPAFEAAGSRPFTYSRAGKKPVAMSYWRLPDSAVDDPTEACRWARMALDASLRASASKAARRSLKPRSKAGRPRSTPRP